MKKTKLFLPVLAVLAMICCLSLFACKKADKESLQSIEITSQPHRTVFMLGEEFSPAGLEVTATFSKSTKVLSEEEYVLDASSYNPQKEGEYKINISYTVNATTVETFYNVSVSETVYEGLEVTIADGATANPYFMISNVIVKEVGADGVVKDEPLDRSEYTIKIYIGATEIDYDGGEVAVLSAKATYQIWAFKNSSIVGDYVLSNFALFTVS